MSDANKEELRHRGRRAAGHAVIVMASRVLGMPLAIVSILLYTRIIKPSELALIPITQMLTQLCYTISNMGMGLYVQRRMPEANETDPHAAMLMGRAMMAVMVVPLILCCLAMAATSELLAGTFLKDRQAGNLVILMIPAVLAICWQTAVTQVMRSTFLFVKLSVYSLLAQILQPAAVIGLYLYWGTTGLVLGLASGAVLFGLLATWNVRRYLFGKVSVKYMWQLVKQSCPFYGEDYAGYLFGYADQWIVGLLMTPSDLAVYYIPRSIFARLSVLMDGLDDVVLATFSATSSRGIEAISKVFEIVRRLFTYLYVPLCLFFASASFFLIDLLGGPEYQAGTIPLVLLCILLLVRGLFGPHAMGVMTLVTPRARFAVILLQGITALVAMIPLMYLFGLSGVPAARVIAGIIGGLVSSCILRRLFSFSFDRHVIRVLLLPSLLLLIICLGGQLLFYHRLVVPLYLAMGLAAYAYFFVRLITDSDVKTMDTLLPSRLAWVPTLIRRWRPAN